MKIHHPETTILLLLLVVLLSAAAFCDARENPKTASSRWLDNIAKRKVAPRFLGCSFGTRVCHNRALGKKARCCGNRCVNVKSDENNCGRCGKRCPFSWRCCNGKCIDPKSNAFHCGGCNNRCAAGVSCTFGLCGYAEQRRPLPHSRHRRRHRRHHSHS